MKRLAVLFIFLATSSAGASLSIQESISNKKSPWSMSGFSLISTEFDSNENGGGRISSYNYFSLNRRLSFKTKYAVRIPFTYASYGYDRFNEDQLQDQEVLLQDIFVSYANYNIGLLPGDIEVYWEGRVYLPTSKHSRNIKMIGRLRNDFILSKVLAPGLQLGYVNKFNYFHQSRTAYENSFIGREGDLVTVASLTKQFEIDHWLEAWMSINPEFGVGFKLGTEDTWWNAAEIEGRKKQPEHLVKIGPSIRFSLSSSANFILALDNKVDNRTEMDDFGKFKPEHTELVLLSFLRF